jgi:hypothetical protein
MDQNNIISLSSPLLVTPLEMKTSKITDISNTCNTPLNNKIKTFYYIGIILLILVILFLVIFLTVFYTMDLELIPKPKKIKKVDDDNIDEYTQNYNYVNQNYNIDISK